ncbi:MAG: hypothetical protein RR290_00545 [Clostridia bacterium]
MEELELRLKAIKKDMEELEYTTKLIERQSSILDCFDKINKEVM